MLTVKSGIGNTKLDVARCGGALAPIAPGVVWNVQGDEVVFVTFDGGRYVVDPTLLRAGMPARKPTPTPHDSVLSEDDIQALTERGAMRGPWAHELATTGSAWSRCSAPLWAQALKEYEANDARVADTATKDRRSRQITATYSDVVEEVCAGERARYERVITGALATRDRARKRLLDLMNTRFASR